MDSWFNLLATPMKRDVEKAPTHLQMELIELQEDTQLKSKFDEVKLSDFSRTYLAEERYPQLRAFARKMICVFGSTYKCEQFFFIMKTNKSKYRTRLRDENLENTLVLCISRIDPNIDYLVSQVQAQASH